MISRNTRALTFLLSLTTLLGSAQLPPNIPQLASDVSPLLIGEKTPDLSVQNTSNDEVRIQALFGIKPTVLIFYRGGWCPYCNLHLAELQGIEQEILKEGYQIVAISPDSPENLKKSIEKNKIDYQLFSDANMELSRAFGIAFAVSEASKERLNISSGGKNPGMLPVPSVFVVNQKGDILFEYINPDYKMRLKGNLLLAVLKELKEPPRCANH